MARTHGNLMLFGFDLAQAPAFLRQGWREALQWPLFARLLPPEPVRVRHPDGSKAMWPPGAKPGARTANALVLPEGLLLRRTLPMPSLVAAAQQEAIELALAGATPFPAEKTVWGWRSAPTASGTEVELVMASRDHVDDFLSRTVNRQYLSEIEVWAMRPGEEAPIVLQGYGEGRRLVRTRRRYREIAIFAAVAVVLFLALLASPVLRKQWDVSDLDARLDAVSREAATAMADRDALVEARTRMKTVTEYVDGHPDPLVLLGRLSALLPDSVYLTRLELHGHSATIAGLADNAASVMENLAAQPGFSEARAPAAITRDPVSGRESFSIDFQFHLDDVTGLARGTNPEAANEPGP